MPRKTSSTQGVAPLGGRRAKIERLRDVFRSDFVSFVVNVLWPFDFGDVLLTDWHKQRLREIEDSVKSGAPKTLDLWFRGGFKSTFVSRYSNQWRYLRNTGLTQLVRHGELRKAQGIVGKMKTHHLYNPIYRKFFPELCPEKGAIRWGTLDHFRLPGGVNNTAEPTVRAVGIDANLAGDHYMHIHDDDIENSSNVNTKETRANLIRNWEDTTSLLCQPPVYPGTHSMVGTPWHADGLWLGHIVPKFGPNGDAPASAKIVYRFYPACTPKLEPLVPEVMDREALEKKLFEQGPYKFSANYLLKPTDPGTAIYKEAWIRYYDYPAGHHRFDKQWLRDCRVRRVLSLDLAQSIGKESDCVGYVIVDMDETGRWFIREAFEQRIDALDLIKLLIRKHKNWNFDAIYVDAVANQRYFSTWAYREAQMQKVDLPICPVGKSEIGNKSKEMRIMGNATRWHNGFCFIVSDCEGSKELVHTMINYPAVGNDDLLDAMAQLELMEGAGETQYDTGPPAGSLEWWQNRTTKSAPPDVSGWWEHPKKSESIRYIRSRYGK